jgi:hypothetical protein
MHRATTSYSVDSGRGRDADRTTPNSPGHVSALGCFMSAAAPLGTARPPIAGSSYWLSGIDAGEGEELLTGRGVLAEHAAQG